MNMLSVKELIIVLCIALPVFMLAKPIALNFTSIADFDRRRRAWVALTIIAFLSPNFWVLVLLAIPVLFITGRRDSNPAAVYLILMQAIPPLGQTITAGDTTLFRLDTFMLLAICVMAPAALRLLRARDRPPHRVPVWIDLALLGYGILSSFQYLQSEALDKTLYPITFTDSIRRVVVFVAIAYIPYFAASRSNTERRSLVDSMASYCVACAVMSAIALYETLRRWLLYGEIPGRFGDLGLGNEYLIRGDSLRAMASSGHPLTLATSLSIAIVFMLYLRSRIVSVRSRWAASLLLVAGLFVTYSRGPWIGAAVGCLAFVALKPRAITALLKTAVGVLAAGAVLSATPFGQRVLNLLPIFGGKVDVGTLTYRQLLLDRAMAVIKLSPWIGDSTALLQMEDLRQGEGIIDLVNVYIQIMLNQGAVGLALFLLFSGVAIARANSIRRRAVRSDDDVDMALLGASLIGSMAGLFVTFAGGSLNNSERIYYMLGALIAAYVAIGRKVAVGSKIAVGGKVAVGGKIGSKVAVGSSGAVGGIPSIQRGGGAR